MWSIFGVFRKQARYLIAGGFAAALEYASFIGLVYGFSTSLWLAQAISFLVGAVTAFSLHASWTFTGNIQPEKAKKRQFILYMVLAAVNVILTSIVIVLLQKIGVLAWTAKVIVMVLVVLWNFVILNKLIFSTSLETFFSVRTMKLFIRKNYETVLLFSLIILFGLLFIRLTPIGAGYDEVSHIIKADATSRLDLIPNEHQFIDSNGKATTIYVHRASPTLADFSAVAFNLRNDKLSDTEQQLLKDKGSQPYNVEPTNVDAWGAAGYNGLAYIPNAIGMKLARVLNVTVSQAIILSKLTALVCYAFVVASAFLLLGAYRTRYIIFFTALYLPITATFAAVSADGFLNALALLLAAFIMRSVLGRTVVPTYLRVGAIVTAMLLPLAKLPYLLISLLVIFTPLLEGRYKRTLTVSFVVVIIFVSVGWTSLVSGANQLQGQRVYCCSGPADTAAQFRYILRSPFEYIETVATSLLKYNFYGDIGRVAQRADAGSVLNRDFSLLYFVVMLAGALLATSEIGGMLKRRRIFVGAAGASMMMTVAGIITAIYVAANSVGQSTIWGVQARYFLPLTVFMFLVLSLLFMWVKVPSDTKRIAHILVLAAVCLNVLTMLSYALA